MVGMLPRGALADFGIVLYDGESPDEEIAQAMMKTAKSRRYQTPILASFSSLGLQEGGERQGVTPQITSGKGLIIGQEVVNVLKRFIKGDSGVRRVGRGDGGYWCADWVDLLDSFNEDCRVGRFSAEGDAKKLREDALGVFKPIQKSVDDIFEFAKSE